MRRASAIATAVLAAAFALPAAPAAAKGLVGMSVCGAEGCVDRTALVGGGRDDAEGLLDAGTSVADPGRASFVRLKMHIGDPATGEAFGTTTLIYLTRSGLIRAEDGTWHMPGPEAATLYKRAAHHVARFPASALKPFRPPPLAEGRVDETFSPASKPAPDTAADDGGGSDFPAGLLGGAAAALVLAAAGAFFLTRRGRPATG
jgi:hypothetical protein